MCEMEGGTEDGTEEDGHRGGVVRGLLLWAQSPMPFWVQCEATGGQTRTQSCL